MKKKTEKRPPVPWYANFTTAIGLALGELLLLSGRPDDLEESIRSILLSAHAVFLSPDDRLGGQAGDGRSLVSAALAVVGAWHEKTEELATLGEVIAELQDVLARLGVQYAPPSESPDSGKH